jgi:heme-degrading monooxygenase HmoA
MIVVSNRIQVAKGHVAEFEQRFAGRARMVESMPGFVRLEILRPMQSDYYIVPTHWKDEVSFRACAA